MLLLKCKSLLILEFCDWKLRIFGLRTVGQANEATFGLWDILNGDFHSFLRKICQMNE